MSNPSKAKGTAAETAVVRYARAHGFPHADRLTLSGRYDRWRCPECAREDSRRNAKAKRARRAAGVPPRGTCTVCSSIPCLCEEL